MMAQDCRYIFRLDVMSSSQLIRPYFLGETTMPPPRLRKALAERQAGQNTGLWDAMIMMEVKRKTSPI